MKRLFLPLAALVLFGAGCDATRLVVPSRPTPGPVACTEEAKQCPDGSYVGRSGPNCEFSSCPSTPTPTPNPGSEGRACAGPSDVSCGRGYECVQECGPPVVREDSPIPGYSCHAAGKPRMCPICLASNTMISTPDGNVNVKDLQVGQMVWTQNALGGKVATPLIKVSHTAVPKTHQVVDLALKDGREAWISPQHPTNDGRIIGELKPGDTFDDSVVLHADLVAYWDAATYDLLPSGETGSYWANGILVSSTLR